LLGPRDDDSLSPPTIKQHLVAINQPFDWVVVGEAVPVNPAASMRGERATGISPPNSAERQAAGPVFGPCIS
jgi:hypothetical protein